jgi:hypothetical protein
MDYTQLGLVLLGAFWAGTNAVFTGIKNTGELRDAIIIGKVGSNDLPPGYIRHLLWVEWLPLKLSLSAISVVLGVIIWQLPDVGGPTRSPRFEEICHIAAALPFIGAIFQLAACVVDGVFMWKKVNARQY